MAADKGYHANAQLAECERLGLRTYIPEPASPRRRRWTDKPSEQQRAFYKNRTHASRPKGRRMQRHRSERVERRFAHMCDTGGARRCWLRGLEKINKRNLMTAAAHNLGILLRALFGTGKPRQAASLLTVLSLAASAINRWIATICVPAKRCFSTAC